MSAPWTCARTGVAISYLPGHERAELPEGWAPEAGELRCLRCRRRAVAEAAEQEGGLGAIRPALARFELLRDPTRSNSVIARAIGASVTTVAKARRQLGEEES